MVPYVSDLTLDEWLEEAKDLAAAKRRNPRRPAAKKSRSPKRTTAQNNAARAMKMFHSGKASSLAEAWAMIRAGR